MNNLNLGRRQDGVKVGDVVLPPWAKSYEDFIRINREVIAIFIPVEPNSFEFIGFRI
jgi:hypothetical protein